MEKALFLQQLIEADGPLSFVSDRMPSLASSLQPGSSCSLTTDVVSTPWGTTSQACAGLQQPQCQASRRSSWSSASGSFCDAFPVLPIIHSLPGESSPAQGLGLMGLSSQGSQSIADAAQQAALGMFSLPQPVDFFTVPQIQRSLSGEDLAHKDIVPLPAPVLSKQMASDLAARRTSQAQFLF